MSYKIPIPIKILKANSKVHVENRVKIIHVISEEDNGEGAEHITYKTVRLIRRL